MLTGTKFGAFARLDRAIDVFHARDYKTCFIGFLLSFAKDNELKVRDGRVAERSKLAELQRVGDTA